MSCGAKKRKSAKKKKENQPSVLEGENISKLDGGEVLNLKEENLAHDVNILVTKENSDRVNNEHGDELVANDHGQVLNLINEVENLVQDHANTVVIKEISDQVSEEHIEAGEGLGCVGASVAVVFQENVQSMMVGHRISEQMEILKEMVISGLCEADKMRATLQKLLDNVTKVQQIFV